MFSKLKLKKSNSAGFTIIEVMIVLAIAGLILLIVFLAVPALQRSARNTQRKNDVGALATGISNFISNNNGDAPTAASLTSGEVKLTGSASDASLNDIKFGYYATAPSIAACGVTSGACTATTYGSVSHQSPIAKLLFPSAYAAAAPTVGPDSVTVLTGATCNGSAEPTAAGNTRSYAIMYELEQSGSTATAGGVDQCQGS